MNPPAANHTPVPPALNTQLNTSASPTISPTRGRGRPRGAATGTGAKRGRKPRGGAVMNMGTARTSEPTNSSTNSPTTHFPRGVHWAPSASTESGGIRSANAAPLASPGGGGAAGEAGSSQGNLGGAGSGQQAHPSPLPQSSSTPLPPLPTTTSTHAYSTPTIMAPSPAPFSPTVPTSTNINFSMPSGLSSVPRVGTSSSFPVLDTTGLISLTGVNAPVLPTGSAMPPQSVLGARPHAIGGDEDGDGEDELLPAMADDDYSAQLSWQSQSKDNLKVLMDNFNPAQYDRFEAYRRHALPKQAVRKVIQQTLGQQVSQPVAQIVAGFAKVFVGEIVEKARAVQTRRGDTGPLSPDHLREAYRMYQLETGRVGAARPVRSKRLFVR